MRFKILQIQFLLIPKHQPPQVSQRFHFWTVRWISIRLSLDIVGNRAFRAFLIKVHKMKEWRKLLRLVLVICFRCHAALENSEWIIWIKGVRRKLPSEWTRDHEGWLMKIQVWGSPGIIGRQCLKVCLCSCMNHINYEMCPNLASPSLTSPLKHLVVKVGRIILKRVEATSAVIHRHVLGELWQTPA